MGLFFGLSTYELICQTQALKPSRAGFPKVRGKPIQSPAQIWPVTLQERIEPVQRTETARESLLSAWLSWAIHSHRLSAEYIYGASAAERMRHLIDGETVPMPPKARK